jgi:hypothetical protein
LRESLPTMQKNRPPLAAEISPKRVASGTEFSVVSVSHIPTSADREWFLGFDCATKTLAFGLVGIALDYYRTHRERLWISARKMLDGELSSQQIADLNTETKALIHLADGAVVDLFPGRPDKSIHTVERIRGLTTYVETRIRPTVEKWVPRGKTLSVPVEFQMGPNAPARIVAASLITQFQDYNVFIVGPSLKNKVYFTEEGKYCYFVAKYKTLYTASKAHAKYNFEQLEKMFGTQIAPTKPAAARGHIADGVMQILGHIIFGDPDGETAAEHF